MSVLHGNRRNMSSVALSLSPIDWLMPRAYVGQILCFPSTSPAIFPELRKGLAGVVADVPHLLSGVVDQGYPKGSVRLADPYQTVDNLISCQDLSGTLEYAALKAYNFPPSAFNVPGVGPPDTRPPFAVPEPVFRAKVLLIKGGTLLWVEFHHCTTDIIGFGALLKLWASHCRTGSSAEVGFDRSWHDRRVLFKFQIDAAFTPGPSQPVPKLLPMGQPGAPTGTGATPVASTYETRIFYFGMANLQLLKSSINEHLPSLQTGVSWVSTGDILAALLWSATVWAEDNSDSDPTTQVNATARIPVNFRSRHKPPLPKDYLGSAVVMTTASTARKELLSLSSDTNDTGRSSATIDDLLKVGLAKIAAAIRTSINQANEDQIREALVYTASQTDIQHIRLSPRHNGISLVSWADERVYGLPWGNTLGCCEAIRIQKYSGKRYPIVLPRSADHDGLEAIVSFDERTMTRFHQSRLIRLYGTLRC